MKKSSLLCMPFFVLAFFLAAGGILPSSTAQAQLSAAANHGNIKIGFFYHGDAISVSGVSDPGAELIVKMSSPETHQTLRKKGKTAGVLWMNAGTLAFAHVPNVYYMKCSSRPEGLLSRQDLCKNMIGYQAMEDHAEVKPMADGQKHRWFSEFLKYKESCRLYRVSDEGVRRMPGGGRQAYQAVFEWPYQAPPGDYQVTVYAVKAGSIIDQATCSVHAETAGLARRLTELAMKHGAIYGALSVLIAIAAGFAVGLIFGKGGGAH